MREQKRKEAAPSGYEPASAWHDELLTNAFELWLGISRLLAAVQPGARRKRRRHETDARCGLTASASSPSGCPAPSMT